MRAFHSRGIECSRDFIGKASILNIKILLGIVDRGAYVNICKCSFMWGAPSAGYYMK